MVRFLFMSLLALGLVGTSFAVSLPFLDGLFGDLLSESSEISLEEGNRISDIRSQTSPQSVLLEAPRPLWQLSFAANHFPFLLRRFSVTFPR